MTLTQGQEAPARSTNLPADFWQGRPSLAHVRAAADSRQCSPDAVLGAVLARLSSFMPPSVRVRTGLADASLNLFAALIGTSSAGKSLANGCAQDLLPVPLAIRDDYKDSIGLGSGEGIAEAFYGEQVVQVPNAAGTGTKSLKQRAVVRENVSFYVDEGEALTKMSERSGVTTGQVLRTAWTAGALGQANANSQTLRDVPRGTYSLGLVIGYQRMTVRPLLSDSGGGTPQRFLFLSAHSPAVWDRVPWPGELVVTVPAAPLALPDDAQNELWVTRNEAKAVDAADEGLNGHWPLHLAKLSALLAVLDGRDEISEEDWERARLVWATSCAVRDGLVAEVELEEATAAARREDGQVRVAARGAVAAADAVDERRIKAVDRIARRLAERVWEQTGNRVGILIEVHGRSGLAQHLAGRDKHLLTEALAEAGARGWLELVGAGAVLRGPARPTRA